MIGVTTVVSMSVGASGLWWWQQSIPIPLKVDTVAQRQTPPEVVDKVVHAKPLAVVVAAGSPPIPSSPVIAPVIVTAQAPAGRMPPGSPMAATQGVKQVAPSQGSKQTVHAAVQHVAPATPKAQPSTQYDSTPVTAAKVAAPAPVVASNIAPVAAQSVAVTTPAVTNNTAYQVVGVPVDGVLQIKIGKDPAIKPIRVGERLPSGEVLRRANSDTGQVETSERSFKVN